MAVPTTLQGTHEACGGTVVFRPGSQRAQLLAGHTVQLQAACRGCGETLTTEWALPVHGSDDGSADPSPSRPSMPERGWSGAAPSPEPVADLGDWRLRRDERGTVAAPHATDDYMARFSQRVQHARDSLQRYTDTLPAPRPVVDLPELRTPRLTEASRAAAPVPAPAAPAPSSMPQAFAYPVAEEPVADVLPNVESPEHASEAAGVEHRRDDQELFQGGPFDATFTWDDQMDEDAASTARPRVRIGLPALVAVTLLAAISGIAIVKILTSGDATAPAPAVVTPAGDARAATGPAPTAQPPKVTSTPTTAKSTVPKSPKTAAKATSAVAPSTSAPIATQ